MPFKPPRFWSLPPGQSTAAKLLAPLGWLYHAEVQRRLHQRKPFKADIPVICVGNATVGGVGKTPFVRHLAERLGALGQDAHVLTRGYGGSETGPLRVSEQHTASEVGDEPLMLAQDLPVWVSADRAAGAQAAQDGGAEVIVMDDGLQNPSLHKDLSLLLVDAGSMFGNGAVFPAGPLRERPEAALKRCAAVIAMLSDEEAEPSDELTHFAAGKPLLEAWFSLDPGAVPDAPMLAFCGIGRPQRFFDALKRAGADLIDQVAFADHHPYTEDDLAPLREDADRLGARLVTTEKDYIRLPEAYRDGVHVVRGRMKMRDEAALDRLLQELR
ncbi:MAG: tetraacyldisaccharide 4'-kinase [Parvularculaceae bacterium]|nr:tetraacyldisaccharide 4'-kinase [Parvularculaceae bacterium]